MWVFHVLADECSSIHRNTFFIILYGMGATICARNISSLYVFCLFGWYKGIDVCYLILFNHLSFDDGYLEPEPLNTLIGRYWSTTGRQYRYCFVPEHTIVTLCHWKINLFVQQYFQTNSAENIEAPRHCPFVRGITSWTPSKVANVSLSWHRLAYLLNQYKRVTRTND